MAQQIVPKASLWVGDHEAVAHSIISYLQKIYCKNNCASCVRCKQIGTKQFHDIQWISSSQNGYKIEDLSHIEQIMSYARDDDKPYFFVIMHSELLSASCGNKLLKSLEDTVSGYHFILATNCEPAVLPTIRSRCFIYRDFKEQRREISTGNSLQENTVSFVTFFSAHELCDLKTFHALLERYKTGCEVELLSLCNQLLEHLLRLYEKAEQNQKKIVFERITHVKSVLEKGIPPGSVLLVLRSLYLQWNRF